MPRLRPRTRMLGALLFVAATVVGAAVVPWTQHRVLRALGYALVAEDPLQPADVIAIAPDVGDAGLLESAELVRRKIAIRVVAMADPRTAVAEQMERLGVDYRDEAERAIDVLRELGISEAELLRLRGGGTNEAALLLRDWAERRRVQSVVLITGADHSRRVRRVLLRTFDGSSVSARVRIARYSAFAPERWWRSRGGVRTGVIELQKLLLDFLVHPLP